MKKLIRARGKYLYAYRKSMESLAMPDGVHSVHGHTYSDHKKKHCFPLFFIYLFTSLCTVTPSVWGGGHGAERTYIRA